MSLAVCACGCGFTEASAAKLTLSGIPHHRAHEVGIAPLMPEDQRPPNMAPTLTAGAGMLMTTAGDRDETSYTVRPDVPVKGVKGKPVKYVYPMGSQESGTPVWFLRTGPAPDAVLLVEGSLQSRSVALWAPDNIGVVGMSGCWGWSHRDLSWARGLRIVVGTDADRDTNSEVMHACIALEDELFEAGAADVVFLTLPSDLVVADNDGPDDLLGRLPENERAAFVAGLVAGAAPLETPFSKKLLTSKGLDAVPPPVPLLPGWLYRETLVRLVGEPGVGKSFCALDWAGHIGAGLGYAGQAAPAKGLSVLYVVAEGVSGIRKRVRAWEQHHGREMTGVTFYPEPVQIMGRAGDGSDDADWRALKAYCRRTRPDMVVFDTQSRCTTGVEENSNTEMARVVERLEGLRVSAKTCALLVHHTAKGTVSGRGASVVLGAVNSEFRLSRKTLTGEDPQEGVDQETVIELLNTKEKDAADGTRRLLRMSVIDVIGGDPGNDPFWVPDTSVVLVDADVSGEPEPLAERLDKAEPLTGATGKLREYIHTVAQEGYGLSRAEAIAGVTRKDAGRLKMSKASGYRAWDWLEGEGLLVCTKGTRHRVVPEGADRDEFRREVGEWVRSQTEVAEDELL